MESDLSKADERTQFPLEPTPWPTKGLRRASVNSFGFGGTNAHAVLDDAFHYFRDHGLVGNHSTVQDSPSVKALHSCAHLTSPVRSDPGPDLRAFTPKLLVLSANDEGGLKRLATQYARFFADMMMPAPSFDSYLGSLAYTLDSRRSLLPWKSYLIAESITDLLQIGSKLSPGQRSVFTPALGFIFTGQGAQWAGMGLDLRSFGIFEQRLREAEEYLTGQGCHWHLRGP